MYLLYNEVNISLHFYRNDVYNFNLNGADEPIIKLGVSQKSEFCILYKILNFVFSYSVFILYLPCSY